MVVDLTFTVGKAFLFINYGQEFEHFLMSPIDLKVVETFDAEVFKSLPRFYSETKMIIRLLMVTFKEVPSDGLHWQYGEQETGKFSHKSP